MTLEALGWDDAWAAASHALEPGSAVAARIVAEHRGAYHAHGPGGVAWCEATGRAFHVAADKRALPTVGDWVHLERWTEALGGAGAAVIREIIPRRNLLVRRAAGEATAPQPLAANLDLGLVMTSANAELSAARLDRYLGLLRDSGIPVALVLSKIDLVADPAPLVAQLQAAAPDAPVIALSMIDGAGLAELRAHVLPRTTAVLLGSSGVGKSSLLNALMPTAVQLTQPIRDDDRGRHTTTRRELFIAGDGSLWIDTPGMRELGGWADEDEDEEDPFDDIAALAEQCKFRDCQHRAEPGCAVRDAVTPERLASFHKLDAEHAASVVKQHAARRIAETRKAKAKRYAPRPGKPDDE